AVLPPREGDPGRAVARGAPVAVRRVLRPRAGVRAELAARDPLPVSAAAVLRRRARLPRRHDRLPARQLLAAVGAVRAVRAVVGSGGERAPLRRSTAAG